MRLAETWQRLWFGGVPLVRLALFRIVILALALADLFAYARTALRDAAAVSAGAGTRPWTPIYLFEVLGLEPIGVETARVVFAAAVVCTVLGILGLFTRTACLGAAVLSTYWTGLVYSFGKAHHDKVALTFALWALPLAPVGARLSLDALLRRWRGRAPAGESALENDLAAVPVRLTQFTVAAGYFFAGWTKLVVAGPGWANGYSLMGMIARYDNVLSASATGSLLACRVMSVGTLLVQCCFPLVFVWPASRWFFLPAALGFHLGTWWTMDTGPYITLWLCLVAFLPLERVPAWTLRHVHSGSALRAAGALAVVVLPTALALRVLYYTLPPWTLPLSLLALGLGFRRLAREPGQRMSSR